MFKDEAEITVEGGRGGDGCVSFRHEKYIPRGGPDGGDGGRGGDVVLVTDPQVSSLLELVRARRLVAGDGGRGRGANCHGKDGADRVVQVPVGSLVRDLDRQVALVDLTGEGQRVVVARGGRGGRGNKSFASPTNRTPQEWEPGEPGERRRLTIELKLMADVGLVGLPNAGKSTFLSRVSRARPKVAAYPFTTLEPELGIVELPGWRRLVVADIPGLIEGAHQGEGLGDQFLRHIERCRVLLHLVDVSPPPLAPLPALEAYQVVRRELLAFSPALAGKPEVLAGNKLDMPGAREELAELARALGREVVGISGLTGEGIPELLERLAALALAPEAATG